jgi:hypothetical protein
MRGKDLHSFLRRGQENISFSLIILDVEMGWNELHDLAIRNDPVEIKDSDSLGPCPVARHRMQDMQDGQADENEKGEGGTWTIGQHNHAPTSPPPPHPPYTHSRIPAPLDQGAKLSPTVISPNRI